MFDKLANFVARRYKGIIIAWIIVLIVAVPLAPKAFDIVKYEETQMVPSNIESEVAQRFIDEHFPTASGQGSTLILLTDTNVLDNGTKDVVFRIDHAIYEETHEGRIDGQVNVDSLYSATTLYTAGFLQQLDQGFYEAWNMTNMTAFALFGIPTEFRNLWYQANGSAFTVYGIPSVNVQIWKQVRAAYPALPVNDVDSMAYGATWASLQIHPIVSSMDAPQQALVFGWFNAYSQAWNTTIMDPVQGSFYSAHPDERSLASIHLAFPAFLYMVPPEGQFFLNATYNSFNGTTWDDYRALSVFSRSLFNSNLDQMLTGLTDEENQMVRLYFNIFYEGWNSTSFLPSELEIRAIVDNSVAALIPAIGGEQGLLVASIFNGLGWSGWNNETSILQFTVNLVAENSKASPWVIYAVKDIPPDASFMQFMAMGETVVGNSTMRDFPIPVFVDLIGMFVNVPKNDTMIISLSYTSHDGKSTLGHDSVGVIRDVVRGSLEGTTGLAAYVTGSDAIAVDLETSTTADINRIDPVTVILVLVLIGVFFRSLVASSVPPAIIGVALGVSFAGVYILGSFFLDVHYSVLTLLLTSMMGAGCDYCIFILSRYREERRNGLTKEESVRTAVTWAGESIATSGATVIIGFGVLSLGRFAMLQSMGIGLAMGVTIALLAALTLLPSVLMLLGDRIFWPSKLTPRKEKRKDGYFTKSAKFAIKHAKAILIAAVVISVPTTYLVFTLETSYDFIGAMPDTESRQGMDLMAEGFGAGRIMSTTVALNMTSPVLQGGAFNVTKLDSIENLSKSLSELNNVQEVNSPTRPLGGQEPINYSNLSFYSEEQATQYFTLMKMMLGTEDTSAVLITVTFKAEPFAKASIDSIKDIRALCHDFEARDPNINQVMVAGATASMSDISDMVQSDFSVMEIFVVIGIYIVLMVVLGSIINPLRSILTILLSISWTIATTMVIFNFILGFPILWMMPMILFVVCLGLGMDYDIFLTTRIREEAQKGMSDKDAIVHAVERTGGIITACGIIMASAFGTMMLSEGALLREFGFALMFAILLDATIVRIYLVPAIMSLLGKWNWYAPGRLQRVRRDEKKKEW